MKIFTFLAVMCVSLLVAGVAQAEVPVIDVTIKDHRFTPDEIKVPANQKIKLNVKNEDATPEEFESHDLKREKIIKGNSSAIISLEPLKAGTYKFFGEFNEETAKGRIIAE